MFLIYFLTLYKSFYGELIPYHEIATNELRNNEIGTDDQTKRMASMEAKIKVLESEVQNLKSHNEDLEFRIQVKELQADVASLMAEQAKMNNRPVIR